MTTATMATYPARRRIPPQRGVGRGPWPLSVCALILSLIASGPAQGQISPGPLSAVHADLDDNSHCLACHGDSEDEGRRGCLTCHKVLDERRRSNRGLHRLDDYAPCHQCHIEHQGRAFQLIWWGKQGIESFDHAKTGWPLEGKHASLDCRRCHRGEFIPRERREELRAAHKDLERTFLGLDGECRSCHEDEHDGQFREAGRPRPCSDCHDSRRWTDLVGFDHDDVWPLSGAHRDVACVDCHPKAGPGGTQRFRPLPHASCGDCHDDPHEGRLGLECASCHTTSSWRDLGDSEGFDHDATGFPLRGAHRSAACTDCHEDRGGQRGLHPPRACRSCHEDVHGGTISGGGDHCERCHDERRWRPTSFTVVDHRKTSFPLEGRHRTVPCGECHRPRSTPTGHRLFFGGRRGCVSCHDNPHRPRPDGTSFEDCETCHETTSFRPSTYDLDRHGDARFALTGAHLAVPCDACHVAKGVRGFLLTLAFGACTSCHESPHDEGPLAVWMKVTGCPACHRTAAWDQIDFDHDRTTFALEGRHRRVACVACHIGETGGASPKTFGGVESGCTTCHNDIHRGQLDGPCRRCHEPSAWDRLLFDHGRDATFHLDGAHATVPCRDCHPTEGTSDGVPLVRYRPIPHSCRACHGADTSTSPDVP